MIRFAVVGLGVGRSRARLIAETEGAELVAVVDLDEQLAQEVGEALGCAWTTELEEVLGRGDVECGHGHDAERVARTDWCAGGRRRQTRCHNQTDGCQHGSLRSTVGGLR